MQRIDALNGEGRRSLPLDLRPHGAEAAGEVDDFWLPRRVLQNGRSLRQRRGHEGVFRSADRDEGEFERPALQPARRIAMHIAVLQVERGAHRLQRLQVQVHRPRSDGATAGEGDDGPPLPRQKRSEDEDGGAHFPHDVVMREMVVDGGRAHRQHPARLQRRDLTAEGGEKVRHRLDVGEARRVGQRQRLLRQQGGGHEGEAGVLRPADGDGSVERLSALDDDAVHSVFLSAFVVFRRIIVAVKRRIGAFRVETGKILAPPRLILAPAQIRPELRRQPRRPFVLDRFLAHGAGLAGRGAAVKHAKRVLHSPRVSPKTRAPDGPRMLP